jgi:conjugative relaxase-like TrwC/TraI family protein
MLRITKYVFNGAIEPYFGADGLVSGKAAEQLGIDGYSFGTVFNDLGNNRIPGTDDKWTVRNVANRRAGWDMLLDAHKSFSIHFAKTRDPEMLRMFCESAQETMQAIESAIQTRVRRGKGADGYQTYESRSTGNGVWATFVQEDARPVNGSCDMHLHAHHFLFNGTFDSVEGCWKAVDLGAIYARAKVLQQMHDDRFTQKLCDAGYKLRSTRNGKELFYISDQDIRTFSRRSALIQQESELRKEKIERGARFLVRTTGITFEQALAVKLGQLGAETRERKSTGKLSKEAQIEHWRQQLGASRWDAMTIQAAKANPNPNHYLQDKDGTWRIATPMQINDYYEFRHQSRETDSPSKPSNFQPLSAGRFKGKPGKGLGGVGSHQ